MNGHEDCPNPVIKPMRHISHTSIRTRDKVLRWLEQAAKLDVGKLAGIIVGQFFMILNLLYKMVQR